MGDKEKYEQVKKDDYIIIRINKMEKQGHSRKARVRGFDGLSNFVRFLLRREG